MTTRPIHTEIPTRRGRRGLLAVPICTAALLVGCTAGSPPDPSPSPSGSIGAEIPVDSVTAQLLHREAEYPGIDEAVWEQLRQDAASVPWRVVSAAGVKQAAACIGQGAPTVVYLNGWGSPAALGWSQAAVAQSESNRVCMFDRPGEGLSSGRADFAPEQDAQEMLAMLQVLGEPGPYLLTGWSYGGLVARVAAAQHPEEVAGLVLVDASSPLQRHYDGDVGPIIVPSVGEGPDMGNKPVIVLEAERVGWWPGEGQPFVDDSEGRKRWHDLQLQAATISDNSLHAVVDDSFHDIPMRHPGAVVAATTAVSESIRAGNATLPPCPDALAAAGATCTSG